MTDPPEHCPIRESQQKVTDLSQDMIRTLRRIRNDLRKCPDCPSYEDCPILADLNNQVSVAVEEITQEWNLTAILEFHPPS